MLGERISGIYGTSEGLRGATRAIITKQAVFRYSLIFLILMKISLSILISLLTLLPFRLNAQVEFIEVETPEQMDAARKKASDQMLMLFVDVYATWCGPCKMMDRDVYGDPSVATYMNTHYVNVKLDGESDYGRIYVREQQLEGYPSMFVFSDDGERVSKIVGYTPADALVSTLTSLEEGYNQVKKYRSAYQNGTLEPGDFASYIQVVREMGNREEAERLASEYVEQVMGPKLSDEDIRVVAFHMDLADVWWEDFYSDPQRLKRVLKEDYMLAMEAIYNNTLIKAIQNERVDLISKMANELAPLVEEETISWDLRSLPFIQYYYYSNKTQDLIEYVDNRFATDRKGDHQWLYRAASHITDMDQQYRTEELLKKELEWYATCISLDEQFDYYFYHGMVLLFLNEQENARKSFEHAEPLASTQEDKEMLAQVMEFLNRR